jgi:hypothetical protein
MFLFQLNVQLAAATHFIAAAPPFAALSGWRD